MKAMTISLRRLATISGAGLGLVLSGMAGARAAAPPLAYHDFAFHYTSNHNATDARLSIGATTLNADGSISFKGSYSVAPSWTSVPASGTESPGTGGGYNITWMAGNVFNRTTFSGAVQEDPGGIVFMTGTRYQNGLRFYYPTGVAFYHNGPFPACGWSYPIIY